MLCGVGGAPCIAKGYFRTFVSSIFSCLFIAKRFFPTDYSGALRHSKLGRFGWMSCNKVKGMNELKISTNYLRRAKVVVVHR